MWGNANTDSTALIKCFMLLRLLRKYIPFYVMFVTSDLLILLYANL